MDEENVKLNKALKVIKSIYRMLDSVKYELQAREYTLNEDDMSTVFYCRDLAGMTIKAIEE